MGYTNNIKPLLTHPLFIGPLGGCFIILLAYLDSKYRDTEREKSTYVKLFVVSSLVFATLTYFVTAEYQVDEFLDQHYDTEIPSLMPKSKGFSKEFPLDDQLPLKRPDDYIESIMSGLPEPGVYHKSSKSSKSSKSLKGKSKQ